MKGYQGKAEFMRLADAIDVRQGDIVSFTGAGGKTSAIVRLAHELAADGWRVLVTTTTRIGLDQLALFPAACSHETTGEALALRLTSERVLFWYSRIQGEKVYGIDITQVPELMHGVGADALLIEADGSRKLPLKAHYSHEPVVPHETSVLVHVVGFGAFGQRLDDEHVYNARGLANLAGSPLGARIDQPVMASALSLPARAPAVEHARIIGLVNAVPRQGHRRTAAQQIARLTLETPAIERVLIGAVAEEDPIFESRRRICAVVLAAGLSRRMGQQKVLLPWTDDKNVLEHVIAQLRAAGLANILVVTGANADAVRAYAEAGCARAVHNPDFAQGEMLSSLQTGIRAAQAQGCGALLVVLGDQPSLRSRNVYRLLTVYAEGRGSIVAPSHTMRRGHPVLIDASHWDELLKLPPGSAPRDVINRHAASTHYVETDDSILRDIDTPEAYALERQRAQERMNDGS